MRQSTRMSNADGRQTTKQGMVAAGMNPNAWVSDVAGGVVGLANAASSYGQAKHGLSPEAQEAQKRTKKTEGGDDKTILLVGAAAAAYFLTKK